MKIKVKRKVLSILMFLAMVFAIATMMGRAAHAEEVIENGVEYKLP